MATIEIDKLKKNTAELAKIAQPYLTENEKISKQIIDKLESFQDDFLGRLDTTEFNVSIDVQSNTVYVDVCEDSYTGLIIRFAADIPLDEINNINCVEDIKKYSTEETHKNFWKSYSKNEGRELFEKYKDSEHRQVYVTFPGNYHAIHDYYPEGNFLYNKCINKVYSPCEIKEMQDYEEYKEIL